MPASSWRETLRNLLPRVAFAFICAYVNAFVYSRIVDSFAWGVLDLHPHPHELYMTYALWISAPVFFLIGIQARTVKAGCAIISVLFVLAFGLAFLEFTVLAVTGNID